MNSIIRPRRLRRTEAIREMVRENHLRASDFIYPLFIHEKDFTDTLTAASNGGSVKVVKVAFTIS